MSDRIKHWAADAAERMLSTFAQATLAALPTGYLPGVSIPWWGALAAGGFAAGICFLKCLAALKVGDADTASLLPSDDGHADLLLVVAVTLGVFLGMLLYYTVR